MARVAKMFPRLPSVERVVSSAEASALLERYARAAILDAVRAVLERLRERIRQGGELGEEEVAVEAVIAAAGEALAVASRSRARPVVNATGVVLHTNLGRALLCREAIDAARTAAAEACALEYDLDRGSRGDRDLLVEEHLCALTGAQAATVVNNNAAAVLLVLNTLAEGREVVASRGELIEIGGSFRIPDVMAKSGAILREVGTTNRTHRRDYEDAIGDRTAVLLKVHTSNYRIVGFTSTVELDELGEIAASHRGGSQGIAVVEDLGSGAIVDLSRWGLPPEPVVGDRLAHGADLVTFSGDKLLGGPQCGLVVGRRELIERLRRNPLKRALRCDKMTLAALEATLRIYRFDPAPQEAIPTLRSLARPIAELERVGAEAVSLLRDCLGPDFDVSIVPVEAQTGSGSQPTVVIDSRAVALMSSRHGPDAIAKRFRSAATPIVGRIENDTFLLDLRTVEDPSDLVPKPS